jgi:ubiquinone/menaquinone biosynthesis C-methylase UbiE
VPTDFTRLDPLNRFSSRAAAYRYRARYPHELLDYLSTSCGLTPGMLIADVGSGTGFLTSILLGNGNRVLAVEPNAEMRAVAEQEFAGNHLFTSLDGRAEALPIADGTVDFITVGQALHWFEIEGTKREFNRVLKPGGVIVVVDNRPRDNASPLMQACQAFQQKYFTYFGTAADPPERVVRLFADGRMQKSLIPFIFSCSEEGFINGFLSSSLAPEPGSETYLSCETRLHQIFDSYQSGGKVDLLFETVVYSGTLK